MSTLRFLLGLMSLVVFTVGVVGGATGFGMVWPWTVGAVSGLLWAVVRAYQTDRERDPVTLPPAHQPVRTPLQLRIDLHNAAQAYHDHHSPEHKAVWPASNGAPE